MRIAFLYSSGRLSRLERVQAGAAPSDFFHGSLELRAQGLDVRLFELGDAARHLAVRLLGDGLGRWRVLPHKVRGDVLAQTLDLARPLAECDVIYAAGSPLAFALAIWQQLGLLRRPLVGLHCGLFNFPYTAVQRRLARHLLRHTWSQLFGDGEYRPLCEFMGTRQERVSVNQCGIDTDFWTPGGEEGDYVLSVGNDGRRDYELLLRAAQAVKAPFRLVTRRALPADLPSNVQVTAGDLRQELLSDVELRTLYRGARCVVIPLLESLQPSGQSVCLQAMACGRPVILTRTRGLWSERMLHAGVNVVLVPPGDMTALVASIRGLLADPSAREAMGLQARETVRRDCTMRGFAQRVEAVCRQAVAAGR